MKKEMIAPGYSTGDKNVLAWFKRALEWVKKNPQGQVLIPGDRGWHGTRDTKMPAVEFRGYAQSRIEAAIDRRGGLPSERGRKDCHEYQFALRQDRQAVQDMLDKREVASIRSNGLLTKEGRRTWPEVDRSLRERGRDGH